MPRRAIMIPLTDGKELFLRSMKEAKAKGAGYQDLDDTVFTGRTIQIKGKEFLNFGNCSYLGLETDPKIKKGAIEAIEKYGSLLSNSRSYFSSPLYSELDGYLKKIFPGYAVVTTTTTLGHCSTLPIMIEKEDAIILDQYVHNSLRMASLLCKANGSEVVVARHNDMKHLSKVIKRLKRKGARNVWFLGDGIYSMQGEFLKIKELIELLNEHDYLFSYIDDAHGVSWTGKKGAGFILGQQEIHPKMIVAVSMCKSFGAAGGIIIFPNNEWAERVRFLGQTLIFSAPINPPVLGAAIASAKIHCSDELEILQKGLIDKILYFREKCQNRNIEIQTKDITPIQFIEIGENSAVFDFNKSLLDNGIFVSSAGYPAMPKKHGGIRVSITHHLEYKDLDYLIDHLDRLNIDKYRTITRHTFNTKDDSKSDIS